MNRSMKFGLFAAAIILALGSLSGLVSGANYGIPWFVALDKPWFMPPAWAFPLAWTTLYILMGFALGQVLAEPATPARRGAITLFILQLLLNLVWAPIFFAAHRIGLALGLIGVLDLTVLATIAAFRLIRPTAALLLVPYALWLALATALNVAIWRLNG